MYAKERLLKEKLVIIARNIPEEAMIPCCEALLQAGLHCVEMTFDHILDDPITDTLKKLRAVRRAFGDAICLGTGSTLSVDEVRAAGEGGAEFIVAPGTKQAVVEETKRLGMASIPGAMSPTEICEAWDMGADIVKVFPADDMGLHYLQNLRGPLPHIPMMCTGGVNVDTIPKLLSAGANCVGTGITVLKPSLVKAGDYAAISLLAKMHADAVQMWEGEKGQ